MLARLRSRRDSASLAGLLGPIALIVVAVLVVPSLASGATMFLYELVLIQILMATSTNFLFGRSHMPSLGQAAFFGTGAYTVALVYDVVPIPAALLWRLRFRLWSRSSSRRSAFAPTGSFSRM